MVYKADIIIKMNPIINPVKYMECGNETIPPPTIVLIIANTAPLFDNFCPISENLIDIASDFFIF